MLGAQHRHRLGPLGLKGVPVHPGQVSDILPGRLRPQDAGVARGGGTAGGAPALGRDPDRGMGLLDRGDGYFNVVDLPIFPFVIDLLSRPQPLHPSQGFFESACQLLAGSACGLQLRLPVAHAQSQDETTVADMVHGDDLFRQVDRVV